MVQLLHRTRIGATMLYQVSKEETMPKRDIIVVGGSAGGIEALMQLVRGLPRDLPAAVFIVNHVSPYSISNLPAILSRSGPLPAVHARHRDAIEPGRIYVAPPDRHLQIQDGHIELTHGPRENHTRPAIDPLFRTAARTYGSRVAGVVLSGTLGDGSMGLVAIKAYGGVAIVQDPDKARFGGMPRTAIQYAPVDHVLPIEQIPPLLVHLSSEPVVEKGTLTMGANIEPAPALIERDITAQAQNQRSGTTAIYTCPDCGGVMWQINEGNVIQFNCHVGHAWSPEILLVQKSEALEATLWACVRMLTEKEMLTRQLATRTSEAGDQERAARIEELAQLDEKHSGILREMLEGMPNPTMQFFSVQQTLEQGGSTEDSGQTSDGA